MNPHTNILLAIDVATHDNPLGHVSAAVAMTHELIRNDAEQVVVLHVREFSVARLHRMMTDGGGAEGQRAVRSIVSRLRASGIHACGEVREADMGHVAQTIIDAAREFDARVIVLGSRGHTDLPRSPIGSVAAHVLHHAAIPVLIVPRFEPAEAL